MKTKLLALFLCCTALLSLAACGGSGSSTDNSASGDADAADTGSDEAVTIAADTVLLDRDGLIITAKELTDDPIWGIGISLELENNSSRNLTVQCSSVVVNNYMNPAVFSCDVAAGKKANDTLDLSSGALEAAGIGTVADIDLVFRAIDSDSYDTVFTAEEIELPTSAQGTVEQPPVDEGQELVNRDGVRIVGLSLDEENFFGAGLMLFIENNSGKDLTFQCDNMSVNGYMVSPIFSADVNSGRMAVDNITILSDDLEKNGIETVEEVELTFCALDADTFGRVWETEPVTFTVK